MCWTMEIYSVFTYQYSVTVNDSVEPVSYSEHRTLLKPVPDCLLYETVGSKRNREHNTLAQNALLLKALGPGFYSVQNNRSSRTLYVH